MTLSPVSATQQLDPAAWCGEVEGVLAEFLAHKAAAARAHGLPVEAVEALADFVRAGGKRLRPVLCVAGWHAAGGQAPAPTAVLQVAASLEMFHAFCLIHDDVMDNSATRRGQPTIHRTLAHHYTAGRTRQHTDGVGVSAAILVGDLALCWSDELIHTAGLTAGQLTRILPVLDVMRTEVMYGQYLDVTTTGTPTDDLDRALAIIRYKTAKYTCERPLHLGALLAEADAPLLKALTGYALPLGEAFQLRDDLLGVFGDPSVTGKSRLDDLREGKHTTLIALALRDAHPHHAALLRHLLGRPNLTEAEAAQARTILTATRARAQVVDLISQRRKSAFRLLDTTTAIAPHVLPYLRRLADTTTRRTV